MCGATLYSCHLQGGKERAAGFRQGRAQPPLAQPDYIEDYHGNEMLQMGFGQPDVPSPAQPTAANAL
jgi:hypothetical protein